MDKNINYTENVTSLIDSELLRLNDINKALSEKKGNTSRWKRIMISFIYAAGMIGCIYFATLYRRISLVSVDEQIGDAIVVTAGVSSAFFLGVLLLRNYIEAKYYNIIFRSELIVNRTINHLQKSKGICKDYDDLLNRKEKSTNYSVEMGEDCDLIIDSVTKQISLLEKRNEYLVEKLLTGIYYIAAIAVGAVLVLPIQNEIPAMLMPLAETNSDRETIRNVAPVICGICAGISILGGPILAKLYFSKIKLLELTDSLIFLIAFSGLACFMAVLLALALIAGVIYIIINIIVSILSLIFGILAVVVIIAIIIGILNGG